MPSVGETFASRIKIKQEEGTAFLRNLKPRWLW
jgi:hypothetical protein